MQSTTKSYLIVAALLVAQQCSVQAAAPRKLPPGITPCSRNDPKLNECAMRNANAAIPLIADGNPSYGMFSLDPLLVSEFRLDDTGTSRTVALDLTANDVIIKGLRHERVTAMKMNLTSGHLQLTGVVPSMEFAGLYKVKGRVLLLPLHGSGKMNITLEDIMFKYSVDFVDAGKKGGLKYIKPINQKMTSIPQKAYINLENLFNGQRALSDQMNVFLNENWREMINDIGPPLIDTISAAVNQFMDAFMKLVPYDEIFPDTPAAV